MFDCGSGCSGFESEDSSLPSPLQRVPGLESFQRISFTEELTMHAEDNNPHLCITVQPQKHFRFRYKTERETGTHGDLQGRSADGSKTYPTVELRNYSGRAVIKCRLYQVDRDEEHPHTLYDEDRGDQEPAVEVSPGTKYMVCFQGLGIIHTAKKAVPNLLYSKLEKSSKNCSKRELDAVSKEKAKLINLHKVRLRFSAHSVINDKEICPPVFSETIFNSKSPTTNILKICMSSICMGRAKGGDLMILLTEKLQKGSIKVNFFEKNAEGERIWDKSVPITKANIHHSCALKFSTPPYSGPTTCVDVKVFIELQRLTDGSCSEPLKFKYIAEKVFKDNKKRKLDSFTGEQSGLMQNCRNPHLKTGYSDANCINKMPHVNFKQNVQYSQIRYSDQQGKREEPSEVLQFQDCEDVPMQFPNDQAKLIGNPVLSQPNVPSTIPRMRVESTEPTFTAAEISELNDFNDFFEFQMKHDLKYLLDCTADSPTFKKVKEEYLSENDRTKKRANSCTNEWRTKTLLKEIFQSKRHMISQLKKKLERLFKIKQSNGDNFLHIALTHHLPCFKFVVDIVHWVGATHLLNAPNDNKLTVLHLAIINELTDVVAYLIQIGCDPLCADEQGNSPFHYAVMCPKSLPTLLNSIKEAEKDKLAPFNYEHQTPLHLSVVYKRVACARLLLSRGAPPTVVDGRGRAPLHIAVYDDNVEMVRVLVDFMQESDINQPDGASMSALQIACADLRDHTPEIVKLLLENGADPYQGEKDTKPAWRLAKKQPVVWDVMRPYLRAGDYVSSDSECSSDYVSTGSDSEDEYLSATEGDPEEDAVAIELESLRLRHKENLE